ncbi:MAG: phosphomannomutase, partial [Halioglobus sp.]|nr:phosphomannomutase [Halioglobus sp.]
SATGQGLSTLVAERMAAYPCSGEINRTIDDPAAVLAKVEETYSANAETVEHVDGLSMVMGDWRFNLRMSNTEPVVRLNVESRGDRALMEAKTAELLALIDG